MIAVPASDKVLLVGQYITEKTGCYLEPGMYQAMAILDDNGEFQGGVAFSDFRGYDCQLSTAAETPMAWRDLVIHAVFDYVFNQLSCVRCTALAKKSNKRARAFLEGLGFVLEGRIRQGYDGVKDAMIYGMLREECRYIQEFTVDGDNIVRETSTSQSEGVEEGTGLEPVYPVGTGQEVTAKANGQAVADFW
jgi:hypothetical protein